jgi:AraC-like DNA-binding protein
LPRPSLEAVKRSRRARSVPVDRLDALLRRFSVSARMFHSGALCGVTDFGVADGVGQLHLVRSGAVEAWHGTRRRERIDVPTLVFYPRPLRHRFVTDVRTGADMACANVAFAGGTSNPIALALPSVVVLRLDELAGAAPVLDVLFREAFAPACGRQQVVDRLFEVVLVFILRAPLDRGGVGQGLLAGLAHARLAHALVAMHARPERGWTLDALAAAAALSRSQFAHVFSTVVGITPLEYLARHRVTVAQQLLRIGRPLKLVAGEVGYGSPAALSRAFTARCGASPRAWLASERG